MRKLTMDELNRKTASEVRRTDKIPVVAVLDNVRSMHNVGSVFRTADAFLLEAIVLCGFTPRPPHRDINKTALGATESVQWTYSPATIDAVTNLRQQGYSILAVEQTEKSIPLHDFSFRNFDKVALVFGNELTGVEDEVLSVSDGAIEIPQEGMKHSLNISVAAGIVFWELFRKYTIRG
jgi:23S rRNA (guanosine2251-2'-O)-methyltransferase